jgi:hypothetical protein
MPQGQTRRARGRCRWSKPMCVDGHRGHRGRPGGSRTPSFIDGHGLDLRRSRSSRWASFREARSFGTGSLAYWKRILRRIRTGLATPDWIVSTRESAILGGWPGGSERMRGLRR